MNDEKYQNSQQKLGGIFWYVCRKSAKQNIPAFEENADLLRYF